MYNRSVSREPNKTSAVFFKILSLFFGLSCLRRNKTLCSPFVESEAGMLNDKMEGSCSRAGQQLAEEARRLQVGQTLAGHQGCVNCLEWSSDGLLLVSGSDDMSLGLWRFPSPSPMDEESWHRMPTRHTNNIFSTSICPATSHGKIVSCGLDGAVVLNHIEQTTGDVFKVSCQRRMALTTHFLTDSATTFLCSLSGSGLHLFDLRTMRCESTVLSVWSEGVFGFSCHPVDTLSAVCGAGKFLRWLDLRRMADTNDRTAVESVVGTVNLASELLSSGCAQSEDCSISGIDMTPTAAALSFMNGPILVMRTLDDATILRGADHLDQTTTKPFWSHVNEKTFLKQPQLFGPHGRFLTHGGDGGKAVVYDTYCDQAELALLRQLQCDSSVCNVVKAHPAASASGYPTIAASGIDRTIKILEPDSAQVICGDLSPLLGERVSVASSDQRLNQVAARLEREKAAANGLLSRRPAYALDRYVNSLLGSLAFVDHAVCKPVATAIALNASLAASKCGEFSVGLDAAVLAHQLDPSNAKALYRKAVCLRGLRQTQDALQAARAARQLLPADAAIEELCAVLQREVAAAEGKLRRACASLFSATS